MRIVVDLDNTLCTERKPHETYADVKPIENMVDYIRYAKADGHYIIISTARNMVTQNGDVGKVIANVGKVTLDWLDNNNIPYDEVHFGKPYGDVYIDDKALRPIEALELDKIPKDKSEIIPIYLRLKAGFSLFIKKLFY